MSKSFDPTKHKKNQPEQEYKDPRCSAHGCPLRGDVSHSQKGDGTKYCTWHFASTDPNDWWVITERINNCIKLIKWRHELLTNPVKYAQTKHEEPKELVCHFNPKYSRPEGMSWGEHLDRIQNYLHKTIMKGIDMTEQEETDFFKVAAKKLSL